MKDSSPYSHGSNSTIKKKRRHTQSSLIPCKKPRTPPRGVGDSSTTAALVELKQLKHLDVPLTSPAIDSAVNYIRLHSDRRYTIGRRRRRCDFVLADRRVGGQHCQVFYDSFDRKLCIVDGVLNSVAQFRSGGGVVRASLNGVFVNGIRVRGREAVELTDGDQVSFACSTQNDCSNPIRIGFVIHKILFEEMYVSDNSQGSVVVSNPKGSKRIFASRDDGASSSVVSRASFLLSECRQILRSDDPISYIRTCCRYSYSNGFVINNAIQAPSSDIGRSGVKQKGSMLCETSHTQCNVKSRVKSTSVCERVGASESDSGFGDALDRQDKEVQVSSDTRVADGNPGTSSFNLSSTDNLPHVDVVKDKSCSKNVGLQPGKNFYLNRLAFEDQSSSSQHSVISLPELLHPVHSISQIFIATFTSDILWFLSSCEIPNHLPVTVACHNIDRCWSSSTENRTSAPYPEYPNLIIVYPPFPETIAFGEDLKRHGIGCHHPKLFVLQRDENIRVIITSANLVPTQWNAVTNTIWWQDFPRRSSPDYSSLFSQFPSREVNQDLKSDFASYLAGFIATLLTDVPSLAQWIVELAKYDFGGAVGHLVASVPGIHSYKTPYMVESRHFACADRCPSGSSGMKFLGSVDSSVVGLSYLFHNATDANGAKLKKLASFLRKSCENERDLRIVLTRNRNIPADANAVSIYVSNPNEFCEGVDCVQLGFLPRNIAKWVSPLWDIGFFRFSGYVCPKEALGAALGGNYKKVRLMLHVLQGPQFQDISKVMQPQHVIALCSLVAAIERCTGLWRLQEVLGQYKWPESLDSEFVYGASSIGSINEKFLAEFSAAAGKKSLQFDSEESDPEWGCWNACHESKSPSIRIIFPTIERVKNACSGIFPSKRVLCFSEKTWQRLRTVEILHDAIPHPNDRIGHPMHTKVARRRFQSRTDSSSYGWVYCGSHNFSAAAWGRSISTPSGLKTNGIGNANSSPDQMLHICNYELGIIFTFPQTETDDSVNQNSTNLDDIVLPFVVPAPKYKRGDRPATRLAMWQALAELSEKEKEKHREEEMEAEAMEEILDEDEVVEATDYVAEEKEDEKAYAEILWSQSSQSC